MDHVIRKALPSVQDANRKEQWLQTHNVYQLQALHTFLLGLPCAWR